MRCLRALSGRTAGNGYALKVSLSTATLSIYPLSRTFALAKELGFDGVELVVSLEVLLRGPAYTKELSRRYGLPILSLHPALFRFPGWATMEERWRNSLALARQLGCPVMVFHAPRHSLARGCSVLDGLLSSGLDEAPRIALENLPWFSNSGLEVLGTPTAEEYIYQFRDFARERGLGVTLDTSHASVGGGDILSAYEALRPEVTNVHFSDMTGRWPNPWSSWMHTLLVQHQLPGKGKLPLRELLRRLRRDGYNGLITLEIGPLALGIWNPKGVKEGLRRSLAFCRGEEGGFALPVDTRTNEGLE